MERPDISLKDDKFVLISQRSRQLAMSVDTDNFPLKSLVCGFLENDQNLYAAVIAPQEELERLAHRVVSFLGAYMRIKDTEALETEILRCIEAFLRKHYH